MSLGDAFGGKDKSTASVASSNVPQLIVLPDPLVKRRAEAMRREKERLTSLAQKLTSTLAPLVREGKVRVTQNSRGVSVEINASVLFDPGDATLTPASDQALRALAVLLKDDPHAVQVEGHTDPTPIRNALFPSNWELSAVRASSVVRLFIDSGVAPARLTVVGNGRQHCRRAERYARRPRAQPARGGDDFVGAARYHHRDSNPLIQTGWPDARNAAQWLSAAQTGDPAPSMDKRSRADENKEHGDETISGGRVDDHGAGTGLCEG